MLILLRAPSCHLRVRSVVRGYYHCLPLLYARTHKIETCSIRATSKGRATAPCRVRSHTAQNLRLALLAMFHQGYLHGRRSAARHVACTPHLGDEVRGPVALAEEQRCPVYRQHKHGRHRKESPGRRVKKCIRPGTLTPEDARWLIQQYVDHYSTVRLHSAIGFITPADMLAGRQAEFHAARDRRLEEARQQRQRRRQQAA